VEVFLELGTNAAERDNFHYEKTDAKGRWTCHHAPRQLHAVRFRSIHPDYVTVLFAPDTTEWKEESAARVSEADLLSSRAVVIMKRGLPLNGLVLDSNQRPIEGAEVSGGDYPVWTPADGRFSFNNCPPGPTVLTAQARGFAPQRKQIFVRDRMDEARFILEPGHTLKVRVLDTKGRPVPGARIASETWQEKGAGQWQWETDAQGRLVWDSAPAEEAFYSISRFGYEAVSSQPLKADGEEHVITLHKLLHITGHVVDSETRAPVAAFRVVPGVLHVDHHDWNQALAINALNGMYAMELPKQDMPHLVRVEAEGYYPEISRTFLDEEEDAVADFALKRGAAISGSVQLPDGQPAVKAQAVLCVEDKMTLLADAQFANVEPRNISETDAQGRFLIQPQQGVKMIAVTHEQGYAEVAMDDFEKSNVVRLQPWCRIAGVLRIGAAPGTNELVQLLRVGSLYPQFLVNSFTALTDSQSQFAFAHVPAGEHIIGRVIQSQFSHGQTIKTISGQTTRVVLGEGGRTVTGQMVVADGRKLDWEGGTQPAFLHTVLPPLAIPKLADGLATNAWLRAYWDSAQGRARQVAEVRYVLQFKSTNVFYAENVPPGVYECEIHYHEPAANADAPDNCLGILRKEVVIAEPQPGQRDEPCDLGKLIITLKSSGQ
jgi:hypothetical protein